MIHLAYVSNATRPMSADDFDAILQVSREFNAAHAITGMLLYRDGTFLQVLEGEQQVVTALYEKICDDPRHDQVKTLFQGPIAQRDFAHWSMGFDNLDERDLGKLTGDTAYAVHAANARAFFDDLSRAKKLLMAARVGR